MAPIGKALIVIGLALAALGFLFLLFPRLPLGRLPGDIRISRDGFHFYFPFTTCVLISVILSLIAAAIRHWPWGRR